jgi:hypothetical protein
MTQKEFIKILKKEKYSYEIEGDKLVVTHEGGVYLDALTSIPPGVEFKNKEAVSLWDLTSLPPGVEFKNKGYVSLYALTSLPPGVEFKNGWYVDLRSLTSISPGVEFRNKGDVNLDALIGEWFDDWKGNIEGIDSNRLLNLMISKEMFI